jgi:hypothetical protein
MEPDDDREKKKSLRERFEAVPYLSFALVFLLISVVAGGILVSADSPPVDHELAFWSGIVTVFSGFLFVVFAIAAFLNRAESYVRQREWHKGALPTSPEGLLAQPDRAPSGSWRCRCGTINEDDLENCQKCQRSSKAIY